MKLTKSSWFIYIAAFLSFAVIEVLKRMELLQPVKDTFVGTLLFSCLVFTVTTVFVFVDGGSS